MEAIAPCGHGEFERLSWAEICARYPDQYVYMVDVERSPTDDREIDTASVVGHGPTRGAAFDPIRDCRERHSPWEVRFTGVSTITLIRPRQVLDAETLAFHNEPLRFIVR